MFILLKKSLTFNYFLIIDDKNIFLVSNGAAGRDRRWVAGGVGRVGVLVITAQTLVGAMAITLAVWLLIWAPSIRFTEVPHYAGIPVSIFCYSY